MLRLSRFIPPILLNHGTGGNGRKPDTPPDLEELINSLVKKFSQKLKSDNPRPPFGGDGNDNKKGDNKVFDFDLRYVFGAVGVDLVWHGLFCH